MSNNHHPMDNPLQKQTRSYYDSDVVPDWLEAVYVSPGESNDFPFGEARKLVVKAALSFTGHSRGEAIDIGCGGGQLSILLAQAGFRVSAIDFSHRMLEEAKINAVAAGQSERITFMQHDVVNTPLSGVITPYSVAIAMGLIEYLPNDDAFFERANSLLLENGWLLVEFRNAAFNATSANAFTLKSADEGTLGREIDAFQEMGKDSKIKPNHLIEIAHAYASIHTAFHAGNASTVQGGEGFKNFFPGNRRQHLLTDLRLAAGRNGFSLEKCFGLHPHPFSPSFERDIPWHYNKIAWELQRLPSNPLVIATCSSIAALFRKSRSR